MPKQRKIKLKPGELTRINRALQNPAIQVDVRKNSLHTRNADNNRPFVKLRSKMSAADLRRNPNNILVLSQLPTEGNGQDVDPALAKKEDFTEPVPPTDVEGLLEQRRTCLLYSISSPKSSKSIVEYVSDDVEVKTIRQDGLFNYNYTTVPRIRNNVRDICAFYSDDFSVINRKNAQFGTESTKERWDMEKLTALRYFRPQMFNNGIRVVYRDPSTVSMDDTIIEITDPKKSASEQFHVSSLKKSAIDKNTLLYSMLAKNRINHFMNCINVEEKPWKWEKRGVPSIPEPEESPKLFVKVEKASVTPFIEPLFVSMAIYDLYAKQKVTESVYFNIVDDDKMDMLGANQPNFINKNLQALFNITGNLSDMFLVVKVDKVLQQVDVFSGSEPYTGTKDEKYLEKMRVTAEYFCQKLGSYRTPLGFQVIDLQRISCSTVNSQGSDKKTDTMTASQCTVNTGIVLTPAGQIPEDRVSITSADRSSVSSVQNALRRMGSATSTSAMFKIVRTPLTKRKFANADAVLPASKDIRESLDEMPSCNVNISTFFRLENDKTSEDEIYKVCQESRRNHGKVNRKVFNLELELTISGSHKSKEYRQHGSDLTLSKDIAIHEAVEIAKYKHTLNKSYKNMLFIYPKEIALSNKIEKGRNLMIKMEVLNKNGEAQAVFVEQGGTANLLKSVKTSVLYHSKNPHFTDEIKVMLPCDLRPGHHVLLTIFHVPCKDGKFTETVVGYTWMPLIQSGSLLSGDLQLPVVFRKPRDILPSYGLYYPHNSIAHEEFNNSFVYCSARVITTVHPQDGHLIEFLNGVASLSLYHKLPIIEEKLIKAINNLLMAEPAKLIEFAHFILSRLLFLIANPPYTDVLSMKAFECLCNVFKVFSKMLDSDIDLHNRSMILASFIKYRKIAAQESKPHSSLRNKTKQIDGDQRLNTSDNTLLNSVIEHVERTPSSTNVTVTNVRLHESILEIWLRASGNVREDAIVHCWFFLEVLLKSCSEHLTMTGRIHSSRKTRFEEGFLKNVETLVALLAQEVCNRVEKEFENARQISNSLGYFLRDCFSIMDRTFVMKLIHTYAAALSEKSKSLKEQSNCNKLLSIKIEFVRVVCSYEHYLIVNILTDVEPPVEGAPTGATPPLSSLVGSRHKKNTAASWILTDTSRSTHYLSGLVLTNVNDAITSGSAIICAKAIETLKELLQSHELDSRIADGESAAQVANIYKPFVGIVLDNMDCLFSDPMRNSVDVASIVSAEQAAKQEVKLQMDLSTTKKALCCMYWVLNHIYRTDLQDWLRAFDEQHMLKLLYLLQYTMSTFEIKDERDVVSKCSSDRTSLTKLDEEPEAGEVKWRPVSVDTQPGYLLSAFEPISCDAAVSCEVFMCVVEIIDHIIELSIESKNPQFPILRNVLFIIMHGLSCNVSDQALEVLFAVQQSFFTKFPAMILNQKPDLCKELLLKILRHCSTTKLESVRTMASISLYHYLRENFKRYKNLTRARAFLSTALSEVLSSLSDDKFNVNDELMVKSLEIVNRLAAEDDTFETGTRTTLTKQVKELNAIMKKIMQSTVRLREHVGDYEMSVDLMCLLVEGYSNNPDLRLTWLMHIAKTHEGRNMPCEAAHTYIQACALFFEYQDQQKKSIFGSKGGAILSQITSNAIKESIANFDSLRDEETGQIQSHQFSENSFLEILNKSFDYLEEAKLYEVMYDFSQILIEYYYKKNIMGKVEGIFARVTNAMGQMKEGDPFYESQSDAWMSPMPGIEKRCFGVYFRVAFFGNLFQSLNNQEYVYKEPAFAKLHEVAGRLEGFYTKMFGEDKLIILKDSKEVDISTLKPDKAYVQITFVDVFLSNDEKMERQKHFERRNNVNRFYFETPYTRQGEARGDIASQCKKRTILTVENFFPYIKTRLPVISQTVVDLSPIEVAIDDIDKKTCELAAAIMRKNVKILTMLVQGAMGTTVNQGPLQIANVFLMEPMTNERGRPIDPLQNRLRLSFIHLQSRVREAIELLRKLVGEEHKDYQERGMADIATKIPDANWVRLEIEPVQVSHDGDTTLNFATVQSVVPGAHGLYYRDEGERKALLFDNNTGKVYPPPNGWESVPIYIHLAHGSRHGTHFADYSKANDAFERNISAVQKLFAAAGLGGKTSKVYATGKTRARSTSKKNQPRSQFDAQPENVNISEESEGRDSEKEKTDKQVEKLKNRNDELKIRVKEYKSDLSTAQLKIKNLEKELEAVKSSSYFDESGEKFVRIDSELDEKRSQDQDEEINNLHNVIEELRTKLAFVESGKKELESKFSENQEYLKNAKDKVSYLENQLNSDAHEEVKSTAVRALEVKLTLANNSFRQVEAEKQKLQEANWYANERLSKLEQENGYLKGITEQLKARADTSHSEKLLKESEKRVWEINEEKSKLEWRLGELSQWWNDAKWKIGELESSVAQQRNLLDTANVKIQCLNDQSNSSTFSIPTDGFTISQSNQGTWQLANGTAQPCFTGAIPSIPLVPTFAGANPFLFGASNDGRNVTLTIGDQEQDVYLTGSFINWKCTLKCEKLVSGKKGVTVNLTRGRHEFRFMINGEWATSNDYQQVPNGLGGQNNIIFVE
ncbi:unnamed protein product [Caenorhabditis sp. 36 PRJEB53466]|nr:unnamed protein product [Caenorhabditis sp. 36 PRJEB53466]